MDALGWAIYPSEHLVLIRGLGNFDINFAVTMKERIGSRRHIRLFIDETLTRQWLAEEGPVVNPPHEVFQRPSGDGRNVRR